MLKNTNKNISNLEIIFQLQLAQIECGVQIINVKK